MPYPGQFHRLVMIGDLYSDVFNMTLNIVPSGLGELGMPAVNTPTLEAVAAIVGAWFNDAAAAPGPGFISAAKLTSIKLNRLGPSGHYVDPVAMEHVYPAPIAGVASDIVAPQLSCVLSLRTAVTRGPASHGRVYPVPNSSMAGSLGTDGRLSAANVLVQANGWLPLITALNTEYALIGRVGVASNAGAGRFEHVTHIGVGRVIDTMRSRRSALLEDTALVAVP